ncbi:hypothetical protein mRhiFer1_008139 [Rhinolophus ferrumequinum]|uniref:Uncharacterized protein n=1 Tax=Rhinolophus ferrumequinum TaxID=59479 RepID=A0A7J7W7G9_RHIFE|nr:hypothetical protein mRhiFer1_008139 [Rhinolophus ferrumequinum]
MRPLHRLICFCRYLRWFTFRFDLPGLSSASLMLLDAESMKLSRSRVASRTSPPSVPASSAAAGVPVSSSSKQQPLSRAPKAPPSPSGEPPKPKGTNGCVLRSAACTAIAAALPRPAAQLPREVRMGWPVLKTPTPSCTTTLWHGILSLRLRSKDWGRPGCSGGWSSVLLTPKAAGSIPTWASGLSTTMLPVQLLESRKGWWAAPPATSNGNWTWS